MFNCQNQKKTSEQNLFADSDQKARVETYFKYLTEETQFSQRFHILFRNRFHCELSQEFFLAQSLFETLLFGNMIDS